MHRESIILDSFYISTHFGIFLYILIQYFYHYQFIINPYKVHIFLKFLWTETFQNHKSQKANFEITFSVAQLILTI